MNPPRKEEWKWIQIFKDKTFRYDADYIWGSIRFLDFDTRGYPTFSYSQRADNIWWNNHEFVKNNPSFEGGVFERCIVSVKERPNDEKSDDPFPIIDVKQFIGPFLGVGRGLKAIFDSMREKSRFVKWGTEKKCKNFLRLLLLCVKRSEEQKTLPRLPIEILYMITTFMRIVETDMKTEIQYPCVKVSSERDK